MTPAYSLLVHSCEGVLWVRRKAPNLYVVVQQEGEAVHKTAVVKRELTPKWEYLCNLSSDSPITLHLWHDSLLRCRDVCLGVARTEIAELVKRTTSDTEFVKLQLTGETRDSKGKFTGTLIVQLVNNMEAATVAMEHAQQDVENLVQGTGASILPGGVVDNSNLVAGTLEAGLSLLIDRLDTIVKIGNEIAKIHPYANIAWKILTSVYQAVKAQQGTDKKLSELVDTMTSVYSFAQETNILAQQLTSLEDKILPIVKQTVECALFIREYTGNGFTSRAIRNTWDNADRTIDALSETLVKLKNSLEGSLTVQGIFLSMQGISLSTQVLQKVDSLVQSDALRLLNPAEMNAASRATCLKGTRTQLLDEITEWLMVPTGTSSVLWLSGVAGSGKSTISTTISVSFRGLNRLGAFLFFDRNNPSRSHPDHVIRTLAYSLARCNPHIGAAISAVLDRDPDTVNTPLHIQLETLILEPLLAVEHLIQGPILIILDALDECGDPHSRRNLLAVISTLFPKLPNLFRFLITSRREADLSDSFATHFAEKSIGTAASAQDVQLFICHEMERIRLNSKLGSESWPKPTQLQAMINLADGLFIWAATAVRFIEGYSPEHRMETLITGNSTSLDALYTVTLHDSAPWDDTKFAMDARAVLACIVFGKVPMTDATIDMLLGSRCRSSEVLKYLGCVIQWRPGCVAWILHASFADYLTDTLRSEEHPWAIDMMFGHYTIGVGCLRILNSHLTFNICGLEDSHIRNADVPDLSSRVMTKISPHLSYSSCFWGNHILHCPFDQRILQDLQDFFGLHFLFWLEVLSLLGQVAVATGALTAAIGYIKGYVDDLEDLIIDISKFVSVFTQLITESAVHIYISAVSFAPKESRIAKQLSRWFPNTVGFEGPLGFKWPAIEKVLRGHRSTVSSVAFSPDGTQLASGGGNGDDTICVWDVKTGALVAGPFTGHTKWVQCVDFSPDGTQIVSGSDDYTVRVWDAQTGAIVVGPLKGHSSVVSSVNFSPDGTQIASGSWDSTICVWNAATGALVAGPFTSQTYAIHSINFSPDGTQIAFGSEDAVGVCDAQTGAVVAGPLTGHTGTVFSVHFSPDGRQIASGSRDRTIRVWNIDTGTLAARPFIDTGLVGSVCFSPDGSQVASGSGANTVRVWDAQTGDLVAGPFTGHTAGVHSVCFSPDGRQIASGSQDTTIRIWDAQAEGLPVAPLPVTGHSKGIESVDYSPNGIWITSGSLDKTIRVWDATTGTCIVGPLMSHSEVYSAHFSPDGMCIASGSSDGSVCVWNAATGVLIADQFEGHTHLVTSVCFSPDGAHIASGSWDKTVSIWDAQTNDRVAGPFTGHTDWVTCVQFSPNGTQIASGSCDKTICVWDAATGALVAGPFMGHNSSIHSINFSPDGTQIASGSADKTVRIWDAQTGGLISGPFTGHNGTVTSVYFSPDGTQIASGSKDMTVRLWDTQTGALIAEPFTGHTAQVNSVCFSPNGTFIVSASDDHTIRVNMIGELAWTNPSAHKESSPQHFPENLIFDADSGWTSNTTGALMFWVPPWLRDSLYLPRTTLIISPRETTKLDLGHFVHGTDWVRCFDQQFKVCDVPVN